MAHVTQPMEPSMHRHAFLILAILGTVVPVAFFLQHFGAHGLALPGFLSAAFANPVASGLTADLLISSAVFWLWMFSQRQGPSPWPFIAMNLLVGLSLALPLYLWLRARHGVPAGAGSAAAGRV
jgi:hypothetical protein